MRIIPERDLAVLLSKVENPARYAGGEYGSVKKPDAHFRVAICFPDLYEIAMSNQAIAIIYGMLNAMEDVACERVFCPAEDFEAVLRERNIPLYGLESGTPLHNFDLVAFSVGYELSATNILTVLDRGGIPLRNRDRDQGDPIIIAGGPAITNPLPFGEFIDAVYIGEAEGELPAIVRELISFKKSGAKREDLLACIFSSTYFWHKDRPNPARRAIWNDFPTHPSPSAIFPVPNIRTVQDHGVVEIMRGCPHGCRFCHAGVFYRPYRMKSADIIYQEVQNLIHKQGYREITLSSLSSGDYTDISLLIKNLNVSHSKDYVSFALPSLHIESFGLHLLSELSSVRKSGLTFAVETPRPEYQMSLNKPAHLDKILSVLKEAKLLGWKLAKFYFMIGLPFGNDYDDAAEIGAFIETLYAKTGFQLNINIGTFIPKPHTPYQWAPQLTERESLQKIMRLKKSFSTKAVKIGYHSPFQSYLEGVISRGDERAGELILSAYRQGARFDAWEDRSKYDVWRSVFAAAAWDVETFTCAPKDPEAVLPWQKAVDIDVSSKYLKKEYENHKNQTLTESCEDPCAHPCGSCTPNVKPHVEKSIVPVPASETIAEPLEEKKTIFRYICSFGKTEKSVFLPHLSLMRVMERGFLRAGFNLRFTEGFNPKPVLEFAQPLPVGMPSDHEIFSFDAYKEIQIEGFPARLNEKLPDGLRIFAVTGVSFLEGEKKPSSLMSRYKGARYRIDFASEDKSAEIENALKPLPNIKNIIRNDKTIFLDHFIDSRGKGFISLFRETFGELFSDLYTIRKIETYISE